MRKEVGEEREEHRLEGMEAGGVRNKNYLDKAYGAVYWTEEIVNTWK